MNVDVENFAEASQALEEALPACSFLALDLEFTWSSPLLNVEEDGVAIGESSV